MGQGTASSQMIAPSPASMPGPLCRPQTRLGDSDRRCSQPANTGRASPRACRPAPPPTRKMRRASGPSEPRAPARRSVGLKRAGRMARNGARALPARASGRSFPGVPGRAPAAVEGDHPLPPPLRARAAVVRSAARTPLAMLDCEQRQGSGEVQWPEHESRGARPVGGARLRTRATESRRGRGPA